MPSKTRPKIFVFGFIPIYKKPLIWGSIEEKQLGEQI
jgi:hypothetical protein